MSQHYCSCFKSGALFDFAGQQHANTAQTDVPKLIRFAALDFDHLLSSKLCSFGDHYNAEIAASIMSPLDCVRYFIDIKRFLRNQNHIRAACYSAVDRDPAGVASHYFHHDHAIVCFSGGVDPVDGFRSNADGRIKSEAEVCAAQIVVNSLWHPDDLEFAIK